MEVETWIRIIKLEEAVKLYCYASVAMAPLKSMNYEVMLLKNLSMPWRIFGARIEKCDPCFSSYHQSEVKWLSKYKATKLEQFFLKEPVCLLYFKKYEPLKATVSVKVEEILQGTFSVSVE